MAAKLHRICAGLLGLAACPAWAESGQEAGAPADGKAAPATAASERPEPAPETAVRPEPIPPPPVAAAAVAAGTVGLATGGAAAMILFRERYTRLDVLGRSGVAEFHYLRQDVFLALERTDRARLTEMARLGFFGPHPIGSRVPVRGGANYLLVPVCGDRLDLRHKRLAQVHAGRRGKVTLSCRP